MIHHAPSKAAKESLKPRVKKNGKNSPSTDTALPGVEILAKQLITYSAMFDYFGWRESATILTEASKTLLAMEHPHKPLMPAR